MVAARAWRRWGVLAALSVALAAVVSAGCGDNLKLAPDDAGASVDVGVADDAAPDAAGPIGLVTVTTAYGPVRGERYEGYRVFRGIPYAAPPVGDLRWQPPQPLTPWTAERDATKFGNDCPQANPLVTGPDPEDCLVLNIYSPDPVPAEPMPVLVWLHGGDNAHGGSAVQWYHGQHLAQRGPLLVVTLNWRLGAVGFLTHPALGSGSGNYGFLDQQAALRWVRDSIGAFGGDKDNVTLAGNAAGADQVCVHLTSPTSAGLFHRAAMVSGFALCGAEIYNNQGLSFWGTQAVAELQGARLATAVGCDTATDVAACLRAKPVADLVDVFPSLDVMHGTGEVWGPHSGTTDVPQRPLDAIEADSFNHVPVLLATTRDETAGWWVGSQDLTEAWVAAFQNLVWGPRAADVGDRYPVSGYESPAKSMVAATSDFFYSCPYRRAARDLAAWETPVYFAYSTFEPTSLADPFLGAVQGTFEVLVFHQDGDWCPNCVWQGDFTPEENALSLDVMDYWIRFARTGDPNGDGAHAWPRFRNGLDDHLIVDVPFDDDRAFHAELCDFLESL
jgi:para-nitrobenzyl esterase